MKPETFDHTIDTHVDEFLRLHHAVHEADQPGIPTLPDQVWRARIKNPPPNADMEREAVWIDGQMAGLLIVGRPMADNRHLAFIDGAVHPEHRGQGIGSTLLDRALAIATGHGRTEIVTSVRSGKDLAVSYGQKSAVHLLEKSGFTHDMREGHRFAPVDHMGQEREEELYQQSLAKAGDYELLSWTGVIPHEQMEPLLRLDRMLLTDVPTGDLTVEEEHCDVERSMNRQKNRLAAGIEIVHTVAKDRATGLYVGHTLFQVYPEPARHAFQGITLVDKEHRGHGLGMLLKIANLRLLRETYPRVELIETGTADENDRMNAINEKFGFSTWYADDHYLLRRS